MKDRILELATECEVWLSEKQNLWLAHPADFERFYKAAHQDGQRSMRERAAKVIEDNAKSCAPTGYTRDILDSNSVAIRNLEIQNDGH